jgi:hypothetical protein
MFPLTACGATAAVALPCTSLSSMPLGAYEYVCYGRFSKITVHTWAAQANPIAAQLTP